VKIIIFRRQM